MTAKNYPFRITLKKIDGVLNNDAWCNKKLDYIEEVTFRTLAKILDGIKSINVKSSKILDKILRDDMKKVRLESRSNPTYLAKPKN